MGVDTRRPILPAPTESIVDTAGSVTGTDLATDVSRRTDKTSYSIPDDGSPVTIPTRRRHRDRGDDSKLSRGSQNSQTSLLIEYFEGGKGSSGLVSRPSVRVRVTPSTARKLKDQKDSHIQITEGGQRKPVYSRRISLSSPSSKQRQLPESGGDDHSISSSNSAVDDHHHSSRHPPLEIEFVNRDQSSELSSLSRDTRLIQPTSDISSMPADSMLDAPSSGPRRKRSQSLERQSSSSHRKSKDLLKTPSRQRSRSLSHERIAHRVAEKLSSDPREASATRRHRRSERGGGDRDYSESDPKSPRRRFHGSYDDDNIMASPESSLLSASAVSSHRKSGDQYSFRSGASNRSSINNPKLLETVEDAIRRLILPELKELKKDQKVNFNTSKFERDMNASYSSTSSPSRDELGRRLSKHASAPDVRKPKVVLNKDSTEEGLVLSVEQPAPTNKGQEEQKQPKAKKSETSHDLGYIKWANRPELSEQDKLRRQKSKGLRDAEKAGLVGTALTAAALQRHESRSTLDDEQESRRGSESRSRAPSLNETELVFQKHNIAPMPLRSAIDTELTRDSLLSQRTADTATPQNSFRYQDIARGSPLQITSPTSRTPNRTPLDARYELGLRHSNLSNHNLSIHSASDHDLRSRSRSSLGEAAAGTIAAAAAANLLDAHDEYDGGDFSETTKRRTLSPIQSVTSDLSDVHAKQQSTPHGEHAYSEGEKELEPRFSISSLSSAPSTNLARSTRAGGISIESQIEILRLQKEAGHELGYEESPRPSRDEFGEDSEAEDDYAYRHSMAGTNTNSDLKRNTNYTEDSELDYLEKANQGQHIGNRAGVNPQFVHPAAVESAVASLLDPSILDTKSAAYSANRSQSNLQEQQQETRSEISMSDIHEEPEYEHGSRQGSPMTQRQDAPSPDATSFPKRMGATSPPQSVTQSIEDQFDPAHIFPAHMRDLESPMPEDDRDLDSESEINTNPSIIQGPAGGMSHDNRDHWAYDATPPKTGHSPLYDAAAAAAGASGGLGLESDEKSFDYGQEDYYPSDPYAADNYFNNGQVFGTPPGIKDEGYVSAPHPLSPSLGSPKPGSKGLGDMDAGGMGLFDSPGADDPFGTSHQRNLSGYSHGVSSPLYDSATGKGIDRIQSKDIVALMDHLTVRDAQRNARDTEILVSLVRSAAEMRNSFEEMKKFIALQDGLIMDASDRQHERTFKALGGPRPLPASAPRAPRPASDDAEELRSKRKNVFKRALKGLSLKSGNDLTRIEGMLEQLLDEVEALRDGQDDMFYGRSGAPRAPSVDTEGYEPEGHAGTSSPDHSGYLSNSSRPVADRLRRDSEHRVSTVHEADEEGEINDRGEFLSPNMASRENSKARSERAESAPVTTPPRMPMASGALASGALSSEATPKTNEKEKEKTRKHKSSSSSFFPKISRWSKTTASSMGDNIRNSIQPGRKERNSFDASRSGDLGAYKNTDYYDPQGDDKIRSTYTLNDQQENRPPSPLVPSQVSEIPKYSAHRDSIDMQHPQPRQGPSGRYQSQLETQAQVYQSPPDHWGSNPSLSNINTNTNRYSGPTRLSPISDAGYSEASSRHTGPPRPPKIRDDGPLIPERPPKVREDDERSYASRVASRSSIMKSPRNTPPPRKPTGPRPLNSGSQYSSPGTKRSRYRGSPDQIDDDID